MALRYSRRLRSVNRQAKNKILTISWLALFFLIGFGVWDFQAGHLMVLAYLALTVIVHILYAFLVRCPDCRVPLLLKPLKVYGMELYFWSLLPPERCRHCNRKLD